MGGEESNFLQIYFLDPDQQLNRRMSIFDNTRSDLVIRLQEFLNVNNTYIQQLKTAVDILRENPHTNLKVFNHAYNLFYRLRT